MSYTVVEVENAFREFYYGYGNKEGVHQWLTAAQISPQAWVFCWELMKPDKTPDLQFFGASTLHAKISRFWHELPAEQYVTLRKKLLECIVNFASGTKIVLTRLCIALSSYIIHTIPEHWAKAVQDIIATFQPQNIPTLSPTDVTSVLLEVLTVLSEEFQSVTLAHSYRAVVRNELRSGLPHVIALLQHVLSESAHVELRLRAIKCFTSWIQFGIPINDCEPLVCSILDATTNDELCEIALEALASIICHQDVHRYPLSMQKLIAQILSLESLLFQSLQNKDMDRCYSIYYLFTNVGETHSRLLLESVLQEGVPRENALHLIHLILQCTGTPGQFPAEEACSGLVFNFWYMLQDDIMSADQDKHSVYMTYFIPIYRSLVEILINKVMLPLDADLKGWNSDDKEQFRCYRQDIQDTLMYCYNLLRNSMLELLHKHLEVAILSAQTNIHAWSMLEACLLAFEAVAESVDLEEDNHLPRLFALLPTLPFSNVKVVSGALSVIGAYSEWINAHPAQLNHIVPLLVIGLQSHQVAPAATAALREITLECQFNMKPFAVEVLSESQKVLSIGFLNHVERLRLMCSVGRLLSILEVNDIMSYLTTLLTPCLNEMERLVQEKDGSAVPPHLLHSLHLIAVLFANLDTKLKDSGELSGTEREKEHLPSRKAVAATLSNALSSSNKIQPVLLVLEKILPVITKVVLSWTEDLAVIEAVCNLLKKAISTLLDDCNPLVADIINLIVHVYQVRPRIPALDLAKQLILLFANDDHHKIILHSMFHVITERTLSLCEKGVAEHTDVIEGFLQILTQVLKKHLVFLLKDDVPLSSLFQCGILALSLLEAPTVKAASAFIVNFITHSREVVIMTNIVNVHGEALLEQILRCIGGEAPRGVIDHMADILLALNKKYFDNLCQWMNGFLARDGFPSHRVNRDQKEHYTRLILKERTNKRKLQETVKEFTLLCRGLLGTDYAAQIMPFL